MDEIFKCAVAFGFFFSGLFYIYYWAQKRIKREELAVATSTPTYETLLQTRRFRIARQDGDVWNISGHVNGQGERWPTHDHHLSMDSFYPPDSIKEYGCAPPPYTKVDLPTYEEAICAMESQKATTITVPVHGSTPTITRPIEQV